MKANRLTLAYLVLAIVIAGLATILLHALEVGKLLAIITSGVALGAASLIILANHRARQRDARERAASRAWRQKEERARVGGIKRYEKLHAQIEKLTGDVQASNALNMEATKARSEQNAAYVKQGDAAVAELRELNDKIRAVATAVSELRENSNGTRPSPGLTPKAVSNATSEVKGGAPKATTAPKLPPVTELRHDERRYSPISADARLDWVRSRQTADRFHDSKDRTIRGSGLPYSHEVPVAIIADDFTFDSFSYEFDAHRLRPDNWRNVMDRVNPRIFVCESAWQGGSPAEHPWQGKIYASVRFPQENRNELLEILAYCRQRGIATVFWNKEDPIHFSDRINDFIRTAALFDYVFTTAEECVPLYRRDVGVPWAGTLPFAVQPQIFNPLGSAQQDETVNFSGTWYRRYPERAKAAELILDRVIESGRDLVIYDRMYSSPSPAYQYPEKYRRFTRPSIPYRATADAYRQSRYGITLNTITDSRTMFARRVFELAASGSVVLSNSATGVKAFFGDSVIIADGETNPLVDLSSSEIAAKQRDAMAVAFANTYRHRAETILAATGIEHETAVGPAHLVAIVRTKQDVERVRAYVSELTDVFSEALYIVPTDADGTNVFDIGRSATSDEAVLSWNELARRDYRNRNLFSARGAFVIDAAEELPQRAEVQLLTSFVNAIDETVALADTQASRYRFCQRDSLHGIASRSVNIQAMFEGSSSPQVFLL